MAEIKNFLYCLNINTFEGRTDIIGLLNAMAPRIYSRTFFFFY